MATGDFRVALQGKFCHGAAGSTPTTETKNVEEVVFSGTARTAERVKRKANVVTVKPLVIECSLDFKVGDEEADTFLTAIRQAFFNKTRIALYPRDTDTGEGPNGDWYITGFKRNETDLTNFDVTAQPTEEGRAFVWQ